MTKRHSVSPDKLSDYIDGIFRRTFTASTELRIAVERALTPLIQHYQSPEVEPAVMEEKLKNPYTIGNDASLRFVVTPERVDELIDSVSLESPELTHQLYEIGHSPRVGLFSYERPKTVEIETDAIIIHQSDENRRRNGIDEVRLEVTTQGVIVIDTNVTGRVTRSWSDDAFSEFAIAENDVISGLKKCFAFVRNLFDTKPLQAL